MNELDDHFCGQEGHVGGNDEYVALVVELVEPTHADQRCLGVTSPSGLFQESGCEVVGRRVHDPLGNPVTVWTGHDHGLVDPCLGNCGENPRQHRPTAQTMNRFGPLRNQRRTRRRCNHESRHITFRHGSRVTPDPRKGPTMPFDPKVDQLKTQSDRTKRVRSNNAPAGAALLVATLNASALEQLAVLLLAHTLPTLLDQRTHKACKANRR